MSKPMRAKARVQSITSYKDDTGNVTAEALSFSFPAKDGAYPHDGSDEDQQFAKYSPQANLSITIANPNLIGAYKEGDTFYLDFVPIEPAA